ncbi:BQ5605_C010g06104 [Microbotryum silenes-dioicae]|uniref:BQ5605_C010g06104 protein n=1 Tax=Microbotryum silenes-dioicae TaxID=796604 RepID=A0A2X0MJS4_9BASI|nr:BQ5605_C010g06104 [Microbotryum silenes-dioicae]
MPAINYEEDTEFNEALRKHGIIPPKATDGTSSRSPSPPPAPTSPSLSDVDDLDELDIDRDDSLSRDVVEKYRAERMAKMKVAEQRRKFGRVYPIGKVDYTREVTEASKAIIEGEPEGYGTGVVCVLYKDSLPACKILLPLLDQLSLLYPSSKFVKIVSDHCIENYPDKNCPTMIVYRNGEMMGQIVGLGAMGNEKCKLVGEGSASTAIEHLNYLWGSDSHRTIHLTDVERILFAFRGIDFHLKIGNEARGSQFSSKTSSAAAPLEKKTANTSSNKSRTGRDEVGSDEDGQADEDSDEDDQTFVGGGRRSGIRNGTRGRKKGEKSDDDDDFDI